MQEKSEIVHICKDEKFIDAAYEIYEGIFPGQNCFLILHPTPYDEIKHLSEKNDYNYIYLTDDTIKKVNTFTTTAKVVVLHSLSPLNAKITLNCDFGNAVKVCHIFGYEIFKNSLISFDNIYGHLTNNVIEEIDPKNNYKHILKAKIKYLIKYITGRKSIIPTRSEGDGAILNALKKIDMIGGVMPDAFEMYQDKSLISDKTEYFKFSYYPIDKIIANLDDKIISDNILLGNSAYPSNNHLEAFETLQELELENRKIIVPLSYGKENYAKEVINRGNDLFGKNFQALTKFMPRDEYHELMQTCGILIMNHFRQQAVGTILVALYMGAKVYLSEKNIIFDYLNRIGCHVFSIENNLERDIVEGLPLLSADLADENRKILINELHSSNIMKSLRDTLSKYLIS